MLNENTLKERIAELEAKLANSQNGMEQTTLSDELKKLKTELSKVKNGTKKKPSLKTNIDAPIVADHRDISEPTRLSMSGFANDISMKF